jgi:UDPglucose 6-dehydrogenase
MKLSVVGMGYVGLANAITLAQKNEVSILEISDKKVNDFNKGITPIKDKLIENYLDNKNLKVNATLSYKESFKDAKFIVVCTPTNFNEKEGSFDTNSIISVLNQVEKSEFKGLVVIRSTIPIGFTTILQGKYKSLKIAFFPEFLREGSALEDNLNPSRIICGSKDKMAEEFLKIFLSCCQSQNIPTIITEPGEAESIKLFSNSFLAMRIAFFNELDSFALSNSLNTRDIITGVSMDPRIGDFYNNPSFGYGGYCLPKDTKQLISNFDQVPQELINATVESNKRRKKFLSEILINHPAKKIGIYRLIMKQNSDNWRESSTLDLINLIDKSDKEIIIYEPMLKEKIFLGLKVVAKVEDFFNASDLVIANRLDETLKSSKKEIFSRDLFKIN